MREVMRGVWPKAFRAVRRTAAAAALVFASVALSLLVLEIAVRLWHGIPLGSTENFVARELDAVHKTGGPGLYDARLGWISAPNTSWDKGKRVAVGTYTYGDYGSARARARVMGSYSGGILPSACTELRLCAHAPPPSEGQSSGRHGTCIAFFGFDEALPRASATSRPPLPAKRHGVLLAKLALTPRWA